LHGFNVPVHLGFSFLLDCDFAFISRFDICVFYDPDKLHMGRYNVLIALQLSWVLWRMSWQNDGG